MPRKPRRCTIKQEPLGSPMRTRSLTQAQSSLHELLPEPNTSRMPPLASLIAAALKLNQLEIGAPETSPASVAPTSPPAKEAVAAAPTLSPSSKSKRRKRETIQLPPSLALASLSSKELRRIKNRISANRLRARSQQSIRHMEEQLEAYKKRCEFLETVVSGCPTCAIVSAVQFGDIELLPAEPAIKKEGSDEELELELDEHDEPLALTEDECIVLGNALHC